MSQLRENMVLKLIRLFMGKYNMDSKPCLRKTLENAEPIIINKTNDIKTLGLFKLKNDESKVISRARFFFIPYNITIGIQKEPVIMPSFRRKLFGVLNVFFLGLLFVVSLTFVTQGIVIFVSAIAFTFLFIFILVGHAITERHILLGGIEKACSVGRSNTSIN